MDTYSVLREFADSWFLIVMFSFFIGICIFAFWPSLGRARDEAASIPFREDPSDCGKDCASCGCDYDFLNEVEHG